MIPPERPEPFESDSSSELRKPRISNERGEPLVEGRDYTIPAPPKPKKEPGTISSSSLMRGLPATPPEDPGRDRYVQPVQLDMSKWTHRFIAWLMKRL